MMIMPTKAKQLMLASAQFRVFKYQENFTKTV